MIIAFSSDVLEKFMYLIEYGRIEGFTNSTLLYLHKENKNESCRYFSSKSYIENDDYFYRLLAFKLTFVILYQVNETLSDQLNQIYILQWW